MQPCTACMRPTRAHQRWPAQAFSVALKTMKKGEEATLEISPACAPCSVHAQRP